MKLMRRLLGVLVMLAGILGLVLSLAGLIAIWALKPVVAGSITNTLVMLDTSVNTSHKAMEVTGQALGATVDSVEALSAMLGTTAVTVEDTKPVFTQLNTVMGETLPSSIVAATDSLKTAQEAAEVLESTMKSLDSFRAVLSVTPLMSAFVEPGQQSYNPEVPLADSLGELAANLEDMPAMFTAMSENLDKADNNLDSVQFNLTTMSDSVALISNSLTEYQAMIGQSQSSMDNLSGMLTNVQTNLATILNGGAAVLSLFFLWLLAAQVVILSQGWELYQGTAGRMEGGLAEPAAGEPAVIA